VNDGRFLDGLERRAAEVLPEPVYRYVRQGARDGVTTREASDAWDRLRFRPQILSDVTHVDTSTTLLGTEVRAPVAVAPTSMQRGVHPDGELAMARAVADSGSLLVLSSNAGTTFEEVAATGVAWWLQMYVTAERATSRPLLERAVAAGARAIVLTADTPVVGTKYDGVGPTAWQLAEPGWSHVNFPPGYGAAVGDVKATDLGPRDVEWLATATGLPVVVKGVLRGDDARRCLRAGAAAIWVSNHGGRQLDYAAATADCLEEVAADVGDAAEVYVDGGVREARHVLAALALGARAAFLGRLPLYALAVQGAPGVERLLAELEHDLVDAMMLAGCPASTTVPRDLVDGRADPYYGVRRTTPL
jgi:4-hydroxymandelate oxidase